MAKNKAQLPSPTTVGQWLAAVADLPRRDCEYLLCQALGLSNAQILAFPDTPICAAEQARLQQATQQLRAGIPVAYVLGYEEFWSLRFEVSPDVLIPRPETELLVQLALELTPAGGSVLDLGTGSGAIAVAIAHTRPDVEVSAVDRSTAALAVAARNAARHRVKVNFCASNWLQALRGGWHTIVCNPPYIAAGDPHLPALSHEPQHALVAAAQGLQDLQAVITQSPPYLNPGGYLILEHGYNQAEKVRHMMEQGGYSNVHTRRDLAHIERATLGCWGT